jgi:hypothetical protein
MTATTSADPAGTLHAVRAERPITAADAAAWFAAAGGSAGGGAPGGGAPGGRPPEVIGYALSARAATWLRVTPEGDVEPAPGQAPPLDEAYEMVLFDGGRELRWLRHPPTGDAPSSGTAVALGEDRTRLPAGDDVSDESAPTRGPSIQRVLAGAPTPHPQAGWVTLRSERYAAAVLPLAYSTGDVLIVESVEYRIEDEHGNVDVADARLVGLRAINRNSLRGESSDEGTAEN